MPVLLLISDANILIDLECANLSKTVFALGYRFGVPDVLFAEELEQQHAHLLTYGLESLSLSPQVIANMAQLADKYRKPSRNDLFALALALAEQCPLLTGDAALRSAAKKEGADTKGTIWLIEEMIKRQLLSITEGRRAYELMKSRGRRLPWDEAHARLDRLDTDYRQG